MRVGEGIGTTKRKTAHLDSDDIIKTKMRIKNRAIKNRKTTKMQFAKERDTQRKLSLP
jgi:hypothetical protein